MGLLNHSGPAFGDLSGWAFILSWHQGGGSGTHHLFGLGEWAGRPVFLTLSDTKITQLLMGLAIKNSFIHRLKILLEKI